MKKLKIAGIVLVLFILYVIIGMLVPFVHMKSVSKTNKSKIHTETFYSTSNANGSDRAKIVSDNQEALDLRLDMIRKAKKEIILSTFDIREGSSSDDIFSELLKASRRGVKIKILVDGLYGTIHMTGKDIFAAVGSEPNVEIRFYNTPNLLKPWTINGCLHDKYIVADHKYLLMGGRNMFDYFLGTHKGKSKGIDREILIVNQGSKDQGAVAQVRTYFKKVWNLKVCKTKFATCAKDTKEKEVAVQIEVGGKTVTIGGMCKGSGMIHPNMCTMLGFVTTDACISKQLLQEALSQDVKDTYNMVSVDGDTSTNDTVLLLANGMAENPEINEKNEDYQKFCEALNYINTTLAKKIAGDGEGATALFEVRIIGAESKEQAVTLSKSIVTSSLTKAAIYGHDANWGRILCAMGYSGAQFDPEKVDLYFESKAGKIQIIENGVAVDYSEEEATKILSEDAVTAIADVKMGDCTATAWGCDLTYDYIKINADYRS